MLLITMGFLIVVLIYINMQRECLDREVGTKSTWVDTDMPVSLSKRWHEP